MRVKTSLLCRQLVLTLERTRHGEVTRLQAIRVHRAYPDTWARSEHEKHVAERTLGTNTGAVRARLVPFFGADTPIVNISTEKIDEYRAHTLMVGGAHGRPLKPSTVARDMTNLSAIFKRAIRKRWIAESPYTDCERIKLDYSDSDFNFLTVEEVFAIARAAQSEQESALYIVAAFTGLRMGELRSLRFTDVDFLNAAIRVRRNLPVGATKEKGPKGGKPRSLPLIDQAARTLDGLSRRGHLTRPDDLVFVADNGGHLGYEAVKDALYAALSRAGLGRLREKDAPVTFHDLRHTFGTRMAAAGVPARSLQEWMGHADMKTTQRYMHYAPRADDAARLSAFIGGQMEPVSPACPEPVHSGHTEANSEQLRAA